MISAGETRCCTFLGGAVLAANHTGAFMLISFRYFDKNIKKKILLSVLYFVKGETFHRFSFLFFGTILSERGQFRKKFREEHYNGI